MHGFTFPAAFSPGPDVSRRRRSIGAALGIAALAVFLTLFAMSGVRADQTEAPGLAPAAPSLAAGDSQLTASWEAPDEDGADITGYVIKWKLADGQVSWTDVTGVPVTATSYTIGGLTNGSQYQVRIRAVNSAGKGPWSPAAKAMPVGAPLAPESLTLTPGDRQLTAHWARPGNGGSPITGYTVQWKSGDEDYGSDRQASTARASHSIGGLTNGVPYTVRVRAANELGEGPWSSGFSGTPLTVPSRPLPPLLIPGDELLTAFWPWMGTKPAITHYVVQWKPAGNNVSWLDAQKVKVPADPSLIRRLADGPYGIRVDILSLTNGSPYHVRIRAVNSAGNGPWSPAAKAAPMGAPLAPASLAPAPGNGELPVSWAEPDGNGSPITGYTVQWKSGDEEFGSERQAELGPATAAYTIRGLTNGTEYAVRVRASNDMGNGDWSAEARSTPNTVADAVPDAPSSLAAEPGNGQLTVSWAVPNNNGSAITGYVVKWKAAHEEVSWPDASSEQVTDASITIGGLTGGAQYQVRVRAVAEAGKGPWSGTVWAPLPAE